MSSSALRQAQGDKGVNNEKLRMNNLRTKRKESRLNNWWVVHFDPSTLRQAQGRLAQDDRVISPSTSSG